MRIIAMKNRQSEYRAMSTLIKKNQLSDDIVPLIEIIVEGGTQDIDNWSKLFNRRQIFADYFRCDMKIYGKVNMEKVKLVIQLNNDLNLYKEKVLSLMKYDNVIPVVTIKQGISKLLPSDVANVIDKLKSIRTATSVAVRIEDISGYEKVLAKLTEDDYVIYDVNEQPYDSKVMEYADLSALKLRAQTILLCSPRKREVNNGVYEDGKPTVLINMGGEKAYSAYGFSAYGDYGGLKDSLPSKGGGGKGYALSLIYEKGRNSFMSYRHNDSSAGPSGFKYVVPRILADRTKLDPDKTCLALSEIAQNARNDKYGNWASWIRYTLMRTAQQL